MNTVQSQQLFEEAQKLFPGGVNSPVRAFRAVGGQPLFIDHGQGAYLYDVDGNRYIDYVLIVGAADLRARASGGRMLRWLKPRRAAPALARPAS